MDKKFLLYRLHFVTGGKIGSTAKNRRILSARFIELPKIAGFCPQGLLSCQKTLDFVRSLPRRHIVRWRKITAQIKS